MQQEAQDALPADTNPSEGRKSLPPQRLTRLAWLPIPVLFLLLVVLYLRPSGPDLGLLPLLPVFNFVFLASAGFLAAGLAARTYLVRGSPTILFLGAGTLAYAATAILASWPVPGGDYNTGSTTWYLGVSLAGFFSLLSAFWLQVPIGRRYPRPSLGMLVPIYLAVLLALTAICLAARHGLLPTFFVKEVGPTALRHTMLGIALLEFAATSLLLLLLERHNRSAFLHWYALGLALIAVGQFGAIGYNRYDSLTCWVDRGCHYLGGIYLLVAVIAAMRQSGSWMIPLATLQETYDRYTRLVDTCPDAILVLVEGRIVFASPAAARLFGASSPRPLFGLHLLDLVHPACRSSADDCLTRSLSGEQAAAVLEIKVLPRNRPAVDVELTAVPVTDEDRPALQVVLRDISERKRGEEALRRAADFPNQNPYPILRIDRAGIVAYANPSSAALAGDWRCEVGRLAPERFARLAQETLEDGQPRQVDVETESRVFSFLLVPVPDSGYVNLYGRDITERRQAEDALRRERDSTSAILETAGALVVVLDKQGRITRFNRACETATGYTTPEVLGRTVFEFLIPPEELAGAQEKWAHLQAESFPEYFEKPWVCKDGSRRLISWNTSALLQPNGELAQIIGIGLDITEQKRAEEALRASEVSLAKAQAIAHLANWQVDVRTNTVRGSQELYRLFNLEPDFTLDIYVEKFHPEDRPRVVEAIRAAIHDDKPYSIDYRIVPRPGEVRCVHADGEVTRDDDGRPITFFGTVQDITDRKQAEQQLKELNATLEQRVAARTAEVEQQVEQLRSLAVQLGRTEQQERQRLASVLHDELQQLLVGAKFRLRSAQNQAAGDTLRQCLADLNGLLQESLKACRDLTIGLSPPILKHGNMKEALCWLADWMEGKHGLHVTIDADEQAHPPSDEIRTLLFQAVRELLFNTAKHAGVNEASVEFKRLDDKSVQAVVRDQGAGFHPSEPAGGSASGSGFGLLAIRERIHYLGGSFEIRSRPGEGTCATLTVPVELPAAAEAPQRQATGPVA